MSEAHPVTDYHVGPHFKMSELTKTDHVDFKDQNRNVPPPLIVAANALVWGLLEPIRCILGERVFVHSAFRCADLNEYVGGSPTSQHTRFEAADFHVENLDNDAVVRFVRETNLPYGQLILSPKHIHISLGWPFREKRGREILDADYNVVERLP